MPGKPGHARRLPDGSTASGRRGRQRDKSGRHSARAACRAPRRDRVDALGSDDLGGPMGIPPKWFSKPHKPKYRASRTRAPGASQARSRETRLERVNPPHSTPPLCVGCVPKIVLIRSNPAAVRFRAHSASPFQLANSGVRPQEPGRAFFSATSRAVRLHTTRVRSALILDPEVGTGIEGPAVFRGTQCAN